MSHPKSKDQDSPLSWAPSAHTYPSTVEGTTTYAAVRIIEIADHESPMQNSQILDVGSGTGALALTAASKFPSASILATDLTPSMLQFLSERKLDNVETQVVDALRLSEDLPKEGFSHAFSTFVFQTIKTPVDVLHEMRKVLRQGGIAGVALWGEHPDPLKIWTKACKSLDSSFELKTEDIFDDPNAWRTCKALEEGYRHAGFSDIRTEEIYMPWYFPSTDAYLEWWFESENPCPLKVIPSWKGDVPRIREAMAKLIREQYDDGHGIRTHAVLGIARKTGHVVEH